MPARKRTSPAITPLEGHVGFWLRYVSNAVSAAFARRVESLGVSVSEWVALRTLYAAGDVAPAALIDALGMTKGAVSKIVTRLEAKGYVERSAAGSGRAIGMRLTSAGRAFVPKLAQAADANDAEFFDALSNTQRDALTATLKQLVQRHGLRRVPVE